MPPNFYSTLPVPAPAAPAGLSQSFNVDDFLNRLRSSVVSQNGNASPTNSPAPSLPYGTGGSPVNFNDIRSILGPDQTFSPGTDRILDIIRSRGAETRAKGISDAQALAIRRGIGGSSIESFGVQRAGAEADKATMDSETKVLLQNLARQSAAKDKLASLTSDELASVRNWQFGQQNLDLQKLLGQQSIDVANRNISSAEDMANQQAKYGLLEALGPSILRGILPGGGGGGGLFGGSGGGGGGGLASLFGFHGAATGAGPGGIPLASAGSPMGGLSGMFSGGFMPNLAMGAAGYSLGQNAFGNSREGNIGGIAGGIAGSFFGPLGSAGGAFLGQGAGKLYSQLSDTQKAVFLPFINPVNTVKQLGSGVKKVGNAVSKGIKSVFRF